MKQVIKYSALLFALVLAATIIGGCLNLGISLVQGFQDEMSYREEVNGEENNGLWYRDEEGDVIFLGIHFGGNGEVKSGLETFNGSEIDSMDIEVGSGELVIEVWENDSISVEYENIPENYEIFVEDDTLFIEREDRIVLWGTVFKETPKIHINVPAGQSFHEIEINKGSGSAKVIGLVVEDLNVDNGSGGVGIANVIVDELSVDSGSGGVNISDTTAEKSVFNSGSGSFIVQNSALGETSMDAGSGFVNFENVVAENLVLDTGSGRVDVSGELTGNCIFESGSGSLNVIVYGEEENYDIRTDMGSGSFYLNGKKEKDNNIEHNNAEHLLVFEAGSGRVSVEFRKQQNDGMHSVTEGEENPSGENYER